VGVGSGAGGAVPTVPTFVCLRSEACALSTYQYSRLPYVLHYDTVPHERDKSEWIVDCPCFRCFRRTLPCLLSTMYILERVFDGGDRFILTYIISLGLPSIHVGTN